MHRGTGHGSHGRDTLVLCYHAISDEWPEALAVGPGWLEAQVSRLLAAGWQATTFTEAVLAPPARRTLAVTFDDGFRSVCRLAAPVLHRLGVPATIFVATAYPDAERPLAWPHIDRWLGSPYEPELAAASWEELAELRDTGWEVGSHSVTHPPLSELAPARLDAELRGSKEEIERRLGGRCRSIAYPYGDVDRRIAQLAKECGYEAGAALLPVRHGRDKMLFPRVMISSRESDALHRLHLRRTVRWLRSTATWPVVLRSLRRFTGEAQRQT